MSSHRTAILALAIAGVLWGLTVPLSKLSLEWLGPAWLTVARFALAAPLLAYVARRGLRDALAPRVLAAGAIGFGAVIVLQNAGIARTSISHAALVVGAVPVLVALFAAALGQGAPRRLAWTGYAVALAGVALVAGAGGGGATVAGDGLVLASAAVSAGFIAMQPRLLAGRDAAAVTAVQFAAGALFALPVALVTEGAPPALGAPPVVAGVVVLALGGTLLPFWLFAHGQAHVPAGLAGAFVNLEPVVGAAAGWIAMGESAGPGQLAGAVAVLAGIAVSTLAGARPRRGAPPRPPEREHVAVAGLERAGRRPHRERSSPTRGRSRVRITPWGVAPRHERHREHPPADAGVPRPHGRPGARAARRDA